MRARFFRLFHVRSSPVLFFFFATTPKTSDLFRRRFVVTNCVFFYKSVIHRSGSKSFVISIIICVYSKSPLASCRRANIYLFFFFDYYIDIVRAGPFRQQQQQQESAIGNRRYSREIMLCIDKEAVYNTRNGERDTIGEEDILLCM